MKIKATGDNILCTDGDFGDVKTNSGIIIKSSTGTLDGIVPRWFKVVSVGPEIDFVNEGDWVYVEYNRWTEGFEIGTSLGGDKMKIWKVDPAACMLVSDEKPESINLAANALVAPKKTLP